PDVCNQFESWQAFHAQSCRSRVAVMPGAGVTERIERDRAHRQPFGPSRVILRIKMYADLAALQEAVKDQPEMLRHRTKELVHGRTQSPALWTKPVQVIPDD